jgi:hypothetical protein
MANEGMPSTKPTEPLADLDASTVSIACTNGVATIVASWLADSYGTRAVELQLTKTDGSHLRRTVTVTHNNVPSGADATATAVESHGNGTHADLTLIDAILSGVGVAQTVSLQITMGATGWTASVVPVPHKAA